MFNKYVKRYLWKRNNHSSKDNGKVIRIQDCMQAIILYI